ncbi:hypothetical protein DLE60_31950 [Micromonospora globispora]|uniref:Uncharacterized protein n=1 Tax=Micromonospora globispora TaxID=1450148 RepID=A0A317KDJ0_9ACTN|nr:hypothetical protein [Micromonospora globispora]PWU51471.1 hypothetical protein DLJ46_04955 [Micromonospora globispora]PWU51889.1 hypothetical protein DLE60_31950 [Micromonospora globispora]RQX00488.1 hypothetical protein DKL51_06725 [Micromonospora globispora]
MSDDYIRSVPTDPGWQPEPEAAAAAVAYVASLFSGPGDAVDEVKQTFYDRVTLIDAGMYTERITCPLCAEDISMDWLDDLVRENGMSLDQLDVAVPCCGAVVELNTLHHEDPIGFARFEVSALNATRVEIRT